MEPAARRAYVFALHRARRQESFDGVVRVTEALVALGDRDMARKGCGIAGALAASAGAPDARERVRALEDRLTSLATSVPAASAAPMRAPRLPTSATSEASMAPEWYASSTGEGSAGAMRDRGPSPVRGRVDASRDA